MHSNVVDNITFPTRPPSASARGGLNFVRNFLRDQFTISTWLLLGASMQALLFLLPIRTPYLLGATFLLLGVKSLDHLLMVLGIRRNVYLDDANIQGKFTALYPNQSGTTVDDGKKVDVDDGKVCIVLVGFRCNHPLGLLAPGFKETSGFFNKMLRSLEANASTNGYLGAHTYLDASSRTTGSSIMTTFYFNSHASLQTFAHGPAHREGWDWLGRAMKEQPHLGIFHEAYEAPRGKWETIYANCPPIGFASTSRRVVGAEGKEVWMSPVAEAKKRFQSAADRMKPESADMSPGYGDQADFAV